MRLGMLDLIFVIIAVLLGLLLYGCGEAPTTTGRVPGLPSAEVLSGRIVAAQQELAAEKQSTMTEHQRALAADRAYAEASGLLESARREKDLAHDAETVAKEEARLAPVRAVITICEIVCVIAAGLGVVAAIVIAYCHIPWGWRIPAGFAGGFGALFVILVIASAALTHLVALAWGLVVLIVVAVVGWAGVALWSKVREWKVANEFRRVGDEALDALEARGHPEIAQTIRNGARGRQFTDGVQHLVAKAIAVSKAKVSADARKLAGR